MSDSPITPDDPRLTAYVLGELDTAGMTAIDAQLADDLDLQQVVDALQQATATLFAALQSEPVPSLSDEQRAAIRQAASEVPVRRSVSVSSSASPRRKGILPLLTAAVACAALLIGVSVIDYDRTRQEATTLFEGEGVESLGLLAYDDGLMLNDESSPERLRRLSRFDVDAWGDDSGLGVDKKLSLAQRESVEFKELNVIDGERPQVRMALEEAEQASRSNVVADETLSATPQVQGLATMTTRPAAPGNPGDAVDPLQVDLKRSLSVSGGRAPAGNLPMPAINSGAQGPVAGTAVGQSGGIGGGEVPPTVDNSSRARFHYGERLEQVKPQDAAKDDGPTNEYFLFAHEPEPKPAGAARTEVLRNPVTSFTRPPSQTGLETIAVPQPFAERAVELKEKLAADKTPPLNKIPARYRKQTSSSFASGITTHDPQGARQFVPMFALSDLRRLSETSGTTPGDDLDGLTQTVTNAVTPEQEMLLGAKLAAKEGESRGAQLEQQVEKSERELNWGAATLNWEQGQWFLTNQAGEKIAVEVPGTEAYAAIQENEFLSPTETPLSTFGLDVDTASYANVRRFLMEQGRFPPPDAVRIEELVNYFTYSDAAPADDEPLAVSLESAACPWETKHRLVRIGLKAKSIDLAERPATTLVFLIDTSGSMRDENKLPLVKQSLRLLVEEMTENDRIAIVTYSSDAGLLLDSTSGQQRGKIIAAIEGLSADGSTNGEAGLKVAYEVATRHFIKQGQNRVILCTDGDFNVGTSDTDPLVGMISQKRASGVFLSICGYGSGNIKDEKLEQIADKGNGQYHYIDNLKEARKVFLDELTGTLYTVAKDVKLQVEFNPQAVASYRLIGYGNRALAAEDFNNDRVDSGDMGAGHSVTALYEVVPVGVAVEQPAKDDPAPVRPNIDPLKYQSAESGERRAKSADLPPSTTARRSTLNPQPSTSGELLTVKLRYKQPDGDESVKREFPLVDRSQTERGLEAAPSADLEWSAAVASFGMLLRSSQYAGQSSLENVLELAQGAKGRDESGRRREFIDMVLQTRSLVRGLRGTPSAQPRELSSVEARQKATVGGKYEDLLDKLEARDDAGRYGAFHDYGWSADKSHAGRKGLPAGYWVYVYPDWYIWGENVSARE